MWVTHTEVHPEKWNLCARTKMGVREKKFEVMHTIDTIWSSTNSIQHWALNFLSLSLCRCGALADHSRVRCRSGRIPKSATPQIYPSEWSDMANKMITFFVHCPVVYNSSQIIAKEIVLCENFLSIKEQAEWQGYTSEQEKIFGTLIESSSCQAGRHRPEQ